MQHIEQIVRLIFIPDGLEDEALSPVDGRIIRIFGVLTRPTPFKGKDSKNI